MMKAKTSSDRKTRDHWLLILFALLFSFVCVFSMAQLALVGDKEHIIPANMLVDSAASYQSDYRDRYFFAPLDPSIIEEVLSDEAGLKYTPSADKGISTPPSIVQLPDRNDYTSTSTETPPITKETVTPLSTPVVSVTPTATKLQNTPTRTLTPTSLTPTPTPTPTTTYAYIFPTPTPSTEPSVDEPTPTFSPSPTNIPSNTPTSSATLILPTSTNTHTIVPPTNTLIPTSTSTSTSTPTFTRTPTSTRTPTPTFTDTSTPSPTPSPTSTPVRYVPLIPMLECVEDSGGLGFTAYFGYENLNPYIVNIPIGDQNMFTPPPKDRGQPTDFLPGRIYFAFSVVFDGNQIRWKLGGLSVRASSSSPPCPP